MRERSTQRIPTPHRSRAHDQVDGFAEADPDRLLDVLDAVARADLSHPGCRLLLAEQGEIRKEVMLDLVIEPAVHQVVYVSTRALIENMAAPLLLVTGVASVCYVQSGRRAWLAGAMAALALASVFRFQAGAVVVVLLALPVIRREWGDLVVVLAIGLAGSSSGERPDVEAMLAAAAAALEDARAAGGDRVVERERPPAAA